MMSWSLGAIPMPDPIVRAIFSFTMKDSRDRLYYRRSYSDGWRRLDNANYLANYAELNRIIDAHRKGSYYALA